MTNPKVYKQGSHLTTDVGHMADDGEGETVSRSQVLKNLQSHDTKKAEPTTTKDEKQ